MGDDVELVLDGLFAVGTLERGGLVVTVPADVGLQQSLVAGETDVEVFARQEDDLSEGVVAETALLVVEHGRVVG